MQSCLCRADEQWSSGKNYIRRLVYTCLRTQKHAFAHIPTVCAQLMPLFTYKTSQSQSRNCTNTSNAAREVLFPVAPNHPSHKQPKTRTVSNFSQKQGYLAWLQLNKSKSNYTQTFKWRKGSLHAQLFKSSVN